MRYVARGLLVLGGVGVVVLLAEIVLRPWPPAMESLWMLEIPADRLVLDDEAILIKPEFREAGIYSATPGQPIVVTLGDSFTAGYPVKEERNYPSELRRLLGDAGVETTVINLGFGDSGPDQHFRVFLRYALPRVRPDAVVWQFCANDLWDSFSKAVFTIEGGKLAPLRAADTWLYRRHLIFQRFPLPLAMKRHSRLLQYFLAAMRPVDWAGAAGPHEKRHHEWALAKIRLELEEMERLAREHGFRFYPTLMVPQVVYMDAAGEKLDETPHFADARLSYALLHELLASHPGFISIHLNAPDDPLWRELFAGEQQDGNPLGSRHFNEAGYALMARRIAERLLADRALRDGARLRQLP